MIDTTSPMYALFWFMFGGATFALPVACSIFAFAKLARPLLEVVRAEAMRKPVETQEGGSTQTPISLNVGESETFAFPE